jgi:glycosyltransferase involved in cell wall biosynthesis
MNDSSGLGQGEASADPRRPLATFAVFAYNQEAYVREAVRAALAQTYRPLEIILSDDASTDRTFQIMQEEARACPDDVDLVLNRSETNLGIAGHMNKVIAMSRGEFLVYTAGDDISMPHQAKVSVEALLADAKGRMALHATVNNIDAEGRFLYARWNPYRDISDSPEAVLTNDVYLTGSVLTVRRALYADFPPMRDDVVNEDKVIAFRCAFFGGAIYIEEPLLTYRAGVGNSTLQGDLLLSRADPEREKRYVRTTIAWRRSLMRQFQLDIDSPALAGRVSPALRSRIDAMESSLSRVLKFIDAPSLLGLPGLFMAGGINRKVVKTAILFLVPGMFRHYKLRRQRNAVAKEQSA